MSGRRNTRNTNTSTTNEDQPNDLEGMVLQFNAALPSLVAQFTEALNANRGNPGGNPSKLHISKCSDNSKVEYAACLLQGRDLTWWNTQKLESEFWNHAMVGSDVDKYTTRFHELAKLVPHMVPLEDKRIDRYIWGLAPDLKGMVTFENPSTIQSVVVLANRLTNVAIRSGVSKKDNVGKKRREENQSKNQSGGNPDKR
ncbi:hypothetical protein Tco_0782472 [Tanacetum coccineum]